jgi:hypothetical protein
MERRVFLTGLLGVAGAAALAATLPREAQALTTGPFDDPTPASGGILPELQAEEAEATEEGVQLAQYGGQRRRDRRYGRRHGRRYGRRYGRRRVRRWRRVCRRYRNRWGNWVRSCRRSWFWV